MELRDLLIRIAETVIDNYEKKSVVIADIDEYFKSPKLYQSQIDEERDFIFWAMENGYDWDIKKKVWYYDLMTSADGTDEVFETISHEQLRIKYFKKTRNSK